MPTYYVKRLLEEACPNHTYPIKHKLKDSGMMQGFLTLGSLTWGADLDEGPDGSDTTPFPEENINMTIFGGLPLVGRYRRCSLGPRIPTRGG
jgi:hypothetical protein